MRVRTDPQTQASCLRALVVLRGHAAVAEISQTAGKERSGSKGGASRVRHRPRAEGAHRHVGLIEVRGAHH
jgi:hypothetical protein